MSDEDPLARSSPPDASANGNDPESDGTGGNDPADNAAGRDDADSADLSRDALRLELERLRERNERLRTTYARAKQAEYRRAALGMGTLGMVALGAAALIPALRTILVVLGATGLFAAVLTYYLTPERFVAVDVGRGVYEAMESDRRALVADLGLGEARVYVPVDDAGSKVRLFVPQYDEYTVPAGEELDTLLVAPPDESGRGVAFTPTGRALYDSFVEAVSGSPPDDPGVVATQLCDALVEQFELIDATTIEYAPDDDRLTVSVEGDAYGRADELDHPVASVVAVGLARTLARPVVSETSSADGDADAILTFHWERTDEESERESAQRS